MAKAALSLLVFSCLLLSACERQYAVTINEQTLYDPRPGVGTLQFADAGLQACVNMTMETQQMQTPEEVTALSCAGLEIRTLNGLEALSNLQFIDVSNNALSHLDALRSLNRMRSITAGNNPLVDISALSELRSLSSASFTGSTQIPCAQLDTLSQRLGANLTRPASCSN